MRVCAYTYTHAHTHPDLCRLPQTLPFSAEGPLTSSSSSSLDGEACPAPWGGGSHRSLRLAPPTGLCLHSLRVGQGRAGWPHLDPDAAPSGDPLLSHLEWQPEGPALHLHPGEAQPGLHRALLQDLRAAGGRRRPDLPAAHHAGRGEAGGQTPRGAGEAAFRPACMGMLPSVDMAPSAPRSELGLRHFLHTY